jgi:hypothetical protein
VNTAALEASGMTKETPDFDRLGEMYIYAYIKDTNAGHKSPLRSLQQCKVLKQNVLVSVAAFSWTYVRQLAVLFS